ncbi:MAG: hypothetical protein GDA48_00815 [Hormoscilla sp. GM102CHS1]|nr:hypothetical protein [Hormoscilla sp. GM102CHS1]
MIANSQIRGCGACGSHPRRSCDLDVGEIDTFFVLGDFVDKTAILVHNTLSDSDWDWGPYLVAAIIEHIMAKNPEQIAERLRHLGVRDEFELRVMLDEIYGSARTELWERPGGAEALVYFERGIVLISPPLGPDMEWEYPPTAIASTEPLLDYLTKDGFTKYTNF